MSEITDEQRAAVEWLKSWNSPISTDNVRVHLQALLAALPDALTNPQPELPTDPGVYSLPARSQAHLGHWHTDGIELHYLNAEGNWCDVGWGNALVSEKRPFTRLVPERPQVTRQELIDLLSSTINFSNGYRADQILALLARNSA